MTDIIKKSEDITASFLKQRFISKIDDLMENIDPIKLASILSIYIEESVFDLLNRLTEHRDCITAGISN